MAISSNAHFAYNKSIVATRSNTCPKCGTAGAICASRIRPSDIFFYLLYMRPVRCAMCYHRWHKLKSQMKDVTPRISRSAKAHAAGH